MEAACDRYLATAALQLSNDPSVLGKHSHWAQNSHLLHGALCAVAECATWFPQLVKTARPWRRVMPTDEGLAERSCAYA